MRFDRREVIASLLWYLLGVAALVLGAVILTLARGATLS